MQIIIKNPKGEYDITGLVTSASWAGDYQQAARTLDLSVVIRGSDTTVPQVELPLGTVVRMLEGKATLFDGFIISRTGTTGSSTLELSCYDRGFYLKRNKASYKFKQQTPEVAAAQLCRDFNISVGTLAATGAPVSRKFFAVSLYDIIMTMYSQAAAVTKKQYHLGFRGDKLYVSVKEPGERTLIIEGGSNLIEATTTESAEKLITSVDIFDTNENLIKTVKDDELIKIYGVLQDQLKQTKDDDKQADADELLEKNGVSQKITVRSLGDVTSMAGGCVTVREPQTGLYGLFYIDSDVHSWKKGVYTNKLVLNFKCMMDETEAGSDPDKK